MADSQRLSETQVILNEHLKQMDVVNALMPFIQLPKCAKCRKSALVAQRNQIDGIKNCVVCGRSHCRKCCQSSEITQCSVCADNVCSDAEREYECNIICSKCSTIGCILCAHFCLMCGDAECFNCSPLEHPNDTRCACQMCKSHEYCTDCLWKCKSCTNSMCDDDTCCYVHQCTQSVVTGIYCTMCKQSKSVKCTGCNQLI